MKKVYVALCLLISGVASAQMVEDSISMSAGYQNQVWYDFETGTQTEVAKGDYELSFGVESGFSSSIRFNHSAGALLWTYPNGTVADWSTVDTNGLSTWEKNYDSPTNWYQGAFDKADPTNQFDLGWGQYDMTTHQVMGDSIYIVKLPNGAYKKLIIESLISGVYTIKYANLDGSSELTNTLAKSAFSNKFFGYFSLTNNEVLDLEPAKDQWDVWFGQYMDLAPTLYNVTGALTNPNHLTNEQIGISDPSTYTDFSQGTYEAERNVIGYDWKTFTGMAFAVTSDVVYFIEKENGDIWKWVPTRFDGSATGKAVFAKQKMSSASLSEMANVQLEIFPNPVITNLVVNASERIQEIKVYSITGAQAQVEVAIENHNAQLAMGNLPAGTYWLEIVTENGNFAKKVIKN